MTACAALARAGLASVLILAVTPGQSLAQSQQRNSVPTTEMPGRERERFFESPIERYRRPSPFVDPFVVDPPLTTGRQRTPPRQPRRKLR